MKSGKFAIMLFVGIFSALFVIILIAFVIIALGEPQVLQSGRLALVEIRGAIYNSQSVIEQLDQFKDDDSIKAIILRINSPGGVVAPIQEIYRELTKIDKKIVVSMGSAAASGGYYISCAADWIFANPGTLTGSIGVIMQFPKLEELMKKLGVKEEIIKSGKYKDAGSLYRDFTQEERELFQATIDDVHNQFVETILEGRQDRGLTKGQIQEIADGRLLSGRQALEKKLVDQLGDLNDAIEYTGKLVGIEGKPKVINIKSKRTLFERLTRDIFGSDLDQIFQDHSMLRYEIP